jgi:D-glycero-beta-D-manno-heptose-7-phosphate kinase
MPEHLLKLIPKLAGQQVIVLGDVILDEYLIGRATRLSREAPVPVLEFEERRLIPGGAANPAVNIVALGSQAIQMGIIGADAEGEALRHVLQTRQIGVHALLVEEGRPTTVKTRIMAHMGLRFPQQVARLDKVEREPINPHQERTLGSLLSDHLAQTQALLLSDYHVGLLTPALVAQALELARAAKLLITSDAQGDLQKYVGFGVVKCNADETRDYLRRDLRTDDDFASAAHELRQSLNLSVGMVITRGADGATVANADNSTAHCPSPAITDVYDTVGAGDTAIAVITLAVAAGASLADAAMLANYASGLVVRRVGNYAPTPDELEQAVAATPN